MIFKKFILVVAFVISLMSIAHEGHDSATAKSLYGGVVKKTLNTYVEVLQDEKIEIFISTHDYKNLIDSKLAVQAVADVKGKNIPLKLELKKNKLIVVTDLSNEKHFKLKITLKFNGKDEMVSFPLENN